MSIAGTVALRSPSGPVWLGTMAWAHVVASFFTSQTPQIIALETPKAVRQRVELKACLHGPISTRGSIGPTGGCHESKRLTSRRPCSTMPSRSSRANLTSDRGIVRQVRTPSISFDDPAQRSRRDTFAASVPPRQTAKTLGTNRRAGTAHRSSRGKSSEREGSHEVRHF